MKKAETKSPEAQLDGFLDAFTPEIAGHARAALVKMRKRLPHSIELVYDNYNALACGFGPTEKTSEAIFSIAVFPKNVSLFFLQGAVCLTRRVCCKAREMWSGISVWKTGVRWTVLT
jgi:hypothetical protein